MGEVSRRVFLSGAGSALFLTAACGNGVDSNGAAEIDARVDATISFLSNNYPGTIELTNKAYGVLYMPLVTEAGFFVGGSYGRGALRIDNVTVDYYSATQASYGLQFGGQQYGSALFFMTEDALAKFRRSEGWAAGVDIVYATPQQGGAIGTDTTELDPVIAMIFGQQGLIAGASIAGTKYTRIIP